MEERRRFIRASSRLTTVYKNLATGVVRRALTRNISEGGMCIITEALITLGTKLEIEVRFPDGTDPVTCVGEVVWSKPVDEQRKTYKNPTALNGVKFVEIDPKARTSLLLYARMNALLPEPKQGQGG